MRRFLFALCLLSLAAPALAQEAGDELPPVKYPGITSRAADAKGFVPAGWRLESTVKGDLNGDGKDDLALVLHDGDPRNIVKDYFGSESYDTNPRMLVVALAGKGGFDLLLADHTLIPRPDNPSQEDILSENGGVGIDRGSLTVQLYLFMTAGGWDTGNWTYRFRLDDRQRFRLIGYDSINANRASGAVDEVSINYLTGKVEISTGTIESDERKTKTKKMKSKPVLYLADIGNGMMFEAKY